MSPATAAQAVAFMIQNSGEQFKVTLSGGENMLDIQLLRYFLDQLLVAKKKSGQKISIGLATNGVNLSPDIAAYLIDSRVAVSISLDGDEVSTDRNRKLPNGQGVYQIVRRNIRMYKNLLRKRGFSDAKLRAECTLDEHATLAESVEHLFTMGFTDVLIRPTDVSPYTAWPSALPMAHFFKLFRDAVGHYLATVSPFDILSGKQQKRLINIQAPLTCLLTDQQRPASCGVLTRSICINSDGSLNPCFRFNESLTSDYIVGNIWDGIDRARVGQLLESFNNVAPDCTACSYNRICSKGCYWSFIAESARHESVAEFEYCRLNKGCLRILCEEVERRFKVAGEPAVGIR
jgi:radical SAM protein with 4Fe4S-binding SPASM domain